MWLSVSPYRIIRACVLVLSKFKRSGHLFAIIILINDFFSEPIATHSCIDLSTSLIFAPSFKKLLFACDIVFAYDLSEWYKQNKTKTTTTHCGCENVSFRCFAYFNANVTCLRWFKTKVNFRSVNHLDDEISSAFEYFWDLLFM